MTDQSSFGERAPAAPEAAPRPAPPLRTDARIVTPEAVALEVDVAGLGSRMIAAILDLSIQGAVLFVVSWITTQVARNGNSITPAIVLVVVVFVVLWGYYPLLEGLWNGQTIGKRAQAIRVVRTDGQPVTIGPVLVRNLIRILEEFAIPFAGVVSMLVSSNSQRLGDLAAGTIVIRERRLPPPVPLPALGGAFTLFDTSRLGDREYEVVRAFLQRRASLTPNARAALAAQIAEQIRPLVVGPAFVEGGHEQFLEAVTESYHARFAPPESV